MGVQESTREACGWLLPRSSCRLRHFCSERTPKQSGDLPLRKRSETKEDEQGTSGQDSITGSAVSATLDCQLFDNSTARRVAGRV